MDATYQDRLKWEEMKKNLTEDQAASCEQNASDTIMENPDRTEGEFYSIAISTAYEYDC